MNKIKHTVTIEPDLTFSKMSDFNETKDAHRSVLFSGQIVAIETEKSLFIVVFDSITNDYKLMFICGYD